MEKELVVQSSATEVQIALLENGQLVELHAQQAAEQFAVGDVLLGHVKKLMPSLKGAFINIGHKKDAFLHYSDLGPAFKSLARYTHAVVHNHGQGADLTHFKLEPEIDKQGNVDQVLQKRMPLMVQILKEPISSKGHRLTCEITIPGRYLVLTPFSNVVAVSKKISSANESTRLKALVERIKPKNFGVIVRTAAEGRELTELHEEILSLLDKWASIHAKLVGLTTPRKLLSELDKTSSLLRDLLNDSFSRITTDDKEMYDSIRQYLETFAPERVNIVTLLKQGRPAFDATGVTRQIKQMFGQTANLPSGAYLVIEHTEALHVIDVNSGHKVSTGAHDEAALNVNLEAAYEIGRQLRLRDLGGIIIVDFIDMKSAEHKKLVYNAMVAAMAKDRAQHTILPLSKFGLMQITRQRTRPEITINTSEACPTCKGTGSIAASILLEDDILRDYELLLRNYRKQRITLEVHPYVSAWLKRGLYSIQWKWFFKHNKWLHIVANEHLPITKYVFYDQNREEIRIHRHSPVSAQTDDINGD